ncbi:MAG: CHASE2 domain-containing protein [Betaproteobacteria bacterium]|nr:MAG: CHASE2 domain-containing protein [Betaproteobacteria bacterium]
MSSTAVESAVPSRRWTWAIGLSLLTVLAALIGLQPRWNARLQAAWFDTYQLLKPRDVASTPVTVVEIDEKSLARLGQWPWPRTALAELLRDIEHQHPAAIGVDILMPESDRLSPERLLARARQQDPVLASRLQTLPSNDDELARAIAAGPVVLGLAGTLAHTDMEPLAPPFIVVDRGGAGPPSKGIASNIPRHAGALANIAALDAAAAGHGLISAGPSDDIIRRIPLVARIDERFVPSFSVELLRVALGAGEVRLVANGPWVDTISVGDFSVPTERDGELRIYYSRRDARRFVSAIDVLDGKVDPLRFERKLVLIGTTGLAMVDYQNTPLGVRMPGSEIQAQLLENLFDQSWLNRPHWAPWLEILVFVLLGLLLIGATPRWGPRNAALLAAGTVALPLAGGIGAFAWGRLVFDAAAPVLGLLLLFSVLLVLTLGEASRQKKRLEQVVQAQREQAAYIAGELEAAKRIQIGFLPRAELLQDERRIELAATMAPAREVGGDFYDFFLLGDDRLFFLIGDVAGKGLSASLFMAVSKALYKSAALKSRETSIGALMRIANDEVSRDNPEMFFVTAFAGALDLESGELTYCNAGHDNPYLLNLAQRSWTRLTEGAGPPLCTVDRFAYQDGRARMQRGELLCLVTDGVLDAQNPERERYGSQRLQAVLVRLRDAEGAARALVDALRVDVQSFAAGAEPADDATVLGLRWIGSGASG